MSLRHVTRRVVASGTALAAACALALFGTAALAGADTQVPNSAVPVGTFTAGTPFSSGQQINVVVPAGTFGAASAGQNLNIEECTAPGKVIPTDPAACDGNTIQGPTFTQNSDGSVNFQQETGSLYTVYALPDSVSLGEGSSGPACSTTVPCVLFLGLNQLDFTQPHVWSQFFYIQPNGNDQGANPGDGSPPPTPTTTTTLTATPTSSVFGQSVALKATVTTNVPATCTPSGPVNFKDGTTSIGSATITAGSATLNTSALAVGSHSITASFPGTASCPASTSSAVAVTVGQASTTTALSAQPAGGSSSGQSVTFTATVSPVSPGAGTPSGTVTFKDGTTTLGTGTLASGSATFTTSTLSVGNHSITAVYGGDTNFTGSTSPTLSYSVGLNATQTSVSASPASPSVFGQSVTFTATVTGTGTPTGTVTFKDGATQIGTTQTLSAGKASVSTSSLAVASHTITATYSGDSADNGSSGTLTYVVNQASTTTSLTVTPASSSVFGQSVSLKATVAPVAPGAGSPTGTVTFMDGASTLGTGTLTAGTATFSTSSLSAGAHTLSAVYGGDTNFATSTSANSAYTVNPDGTSSVLTSSANPSTPGQTVTFTDTVSAAAPGSGTPTGTVTFLDGATTLGTSPLSGGVATFSTSSLALGTHAITASYAPTTDFAGSTSNTVNQVVAQNTSTTTLTSSVNPSTPGQAVTFTATVTASAGTATGTVTFNDGSTAIGTGTLSGGKATLVTSSLALGTHAITAVYGGTAAIAGSTSNTVNQVVALLSSTSTLTSSANPSAPGQSVTFTDTVTASSGTPTGTVTFNDGSTAIGTGTLNAAGQATLVTSSLALGTHPITAVYGGSSSVAGSTSNTVNQVVANISTTTTLTSSANPSGPGQAVTFTATVKAASGATPTGTVTFNDGTTAIGTGALNAAGQATFTTSTLAIGSHSITAVYGGAGSDLGSTSAVLTQVVERLTTTLVATPQIVLYPFSSIIPAVQGTLTVGGVPVPGQTISFTAAGQALCSATTNAAGVATCTPTGAGELYVILSFGYTASFAGTPALSPATGAAAFLAL